MVEAIDDGRIVTVDESYALREGLPILRKIQSSGIQEANSFKNEGTDKKKFYITGDDEIKRMRIQQKPLLSSLDENFNWIITKRRRDMRVSRKNVADAIGEKEEDIKILEAGALPHNNLAIISKIESYFGVVLRKSREWGQQPVRKEISSPKEKLTNSDSKKNSNNENLLGDDLQIFQ